NANEIYRSSATREFNATIDLSFSVYKDSGTLYYLFSDSDNLSIEAVQASAHLQSFEITRVNQTLQGLNTSRQNYVYMYTERDGLISELVKLDIINEVIVEIRTVNQLNAMITAFDSIGKYYILMNDIDISTGRLD